MSAVPPVGPVTGPVATRLAGTDYTGEFTAEEIAEAKPLTIIGYLGILFLVPLLAQPNNRYARFHVNQSIIVLGVNVATWVAVMVLAFIPVVRFFAGVLWLAPLVLLIMGIVNAANGRAKTLPWVGQYTILK